MFRIVVFVAMWSCASIPPAVLVDSGGEPIHEPVALPVILGPVVDAASNYNDSTVLAPSAASSAMFAQIQAAVRGVGVLAHDARIDLAARDLAGVVDGGVSPSRALIEFALRTHGIVESAQQVAVARAESPEQAALQLTAKFGDSLYHSNVRIGFGAANNVTVAVALYTAAVRIGPVPRSATGRFELTGELVAQFHDPRVAITDGHARTQPSVTIEDRGRFHVPISCGAEPGVRWISVEAETASTPQLLVQFPVYCDTQPPATFKVEPAANVVGVSAPIDVERRLTSIVNRERVTARRAPLRSEPNVVAVARQYAERIRIAHAIAHDVDGHTPEDRLRAAGVTPVFALEAIVRAEDLGGVIESLTNDLAEHALLESEDVTHIGIGVAVDAGHELYVVVMYVQLPVTVDPVGATAMIVNQIRHGQSVRVDADLTLIAQGYASGLAMGRPQDDLWKQVLVALSLLPRRHRNVSAAVEACFNLDRIDGTALVRGRALGPLPVIGVAVAQSSRTGPLHGKIWIVVLFDYESAVSAAGSPGMRVRVPGLYLLL